MSSLINFTKRLGNSKMTDSGVPIGEYLVVSYSWESKDNYQIFRLHDGKLFLSTIFISLTDAKEMAKWFDETYRDYMVIWNDYPDADIISLTKWSVEHGIKIYEMVEQIKNKSVSKTDLGIAWETANNWMD